MIGGEKVSNDLGAYNLPKDINFLPMNYFNPSNNGYGY